MDEVAFGEKKLEDPRSDFGVAAQLTWTMSKLKLRNTFIGTPHWMAPEVIQESRYDGKCRYEHHMPYVYTLKILCKSLVFHDFVAKCLTKEPRLRPTAAEILKHKFIERCKFGASAMLPKIEKSRQESECAKLNEDYGDTVPSKPQNVPAASTLRNQHIPEDVELDGEEPSSLHGLVEAPSVSVAGGKSAETRVDTRVANNVSAESHPVAQTVQASSPLTSVSSEENPKINNTSQGKLGIGGDVSSSTLKSETISKKAFALQDKLWSIYAAGNTVLIPFLRATDISPIALLSDNVVGAMQRDDSGTVAVEAVQELFTSDGQSKKGCRGLNEMPFPPSVYQRLTSSSTLMNLAQALAYHRMYELFNCSITALSISFVK
ncbi:hypothetical protein LWI29_008036 [Acer saccharum]|uniref:Protein kinase domain-containing protein n=1 Tax=Acer saccharum TaxID=4024 RepID=A0AA39RGA2_ACESA|nr:hypothetical protein LWI29_008036 [Acer saccharum]